MQTNDEVRDFMQKLSKEQRRSWESSGYLHLEKVFDPEEVTFFCEQIDQLRARPGWEPTPPIMTAMDLLIWW